MFAFSFRLHQIERSTLATLFFSPFSAVLHVKETEITKSAKILYKDIFSLEICEVNRNTMIKLEVFVAMAIIIGGTLLVTVDAVQGKFQSHIHNYVSNRIYSTCVLVCCPSHHEF